MRDLAERSSNHLSNMSYRFFSNRFAGSLVNQVNKFSGAFERLADTMTWNVYKLTVGLIATCVVLWPKAPYVVIGIFTLTAIYTPVVWYFRRKQVPYNKRWAQAETNRTGQLSDTIGNIIAVKSFSNEQLERKLIRKRFDDVYKRSTDTMTINMNQEFVSGIIQRSLNVMVIGLSIWLATHGKIELGVVYLSLEYSRSILRRLWDLNGAFRNLTRVFGDAHDMTQIMQIEPEVKDPAQPQIPKISNGHIVFNDVVFKYKEEGHRTDSLFEELQIDIKPGEKIGLVGPSGSGKTTITKLLLRFMDIQSGSITIDSQDVSKISQQDLRSFIAYVSQEPALFHRSILDNISYGNLKASEEDILKAARLANAEEFITQLPDGYQTMVGERGVKLSGGQKQRIAIARAMLKDAPILVLDEATSALDSESEVLIQDALWKLMESKTALVIAHRLSTIQKMDRIIVLDKGAIVEQGSHSKLLSKNGIYAKLWAHQSGGFIEE
ncbi:ABC transporter ATP-binding protein, partial [Candidatus Saccharibacteria bacterium]|nr:ABC transporter ATP-binding protein [Candidatus Saccharibacteria bacterium]